MGPCAMKYAHMCLCLVHVYVYMDLHKYFLGKSLLLSYMLNPIRPGVLDPGKTPGGLLFDLETLYML